MQDKSTMKRNSQRHLNPSIIELSDSDDDNKPLKKPLDKNFTMVLSQEKTRQKSKANNKKAITKSVKKNIQNKNVKPIKRKKQEKEIETFDNKKQKLEILSNSNFDGRKDGKDLNRDDVKLDINIQAKSNFTQCVEWTDVDYISEFNNVDRHIAENIVKLFNGDNTIPFIARYRKNLTGSMEADQLRILKDSFDQVKIIKHRAATIIKTIDKSGNWSPEIHSIITATKSLADLENIYSLCKPTPKRSLAERAKALGLENISNAILLGQNISTLTSLVDKKKEGLQNEEQVREGIMHIIADIISKDKKVFDEVTSFRKMFIMGIQTMRNKTMENSENKSKKTDEQKYEMYFNFMINERSIKPHQILAINRGESQKILNVKIIVPDALERSFKNYCLSRYVLATKASKLHLDLLHNSINYAYKKLISPLIIRRVRTEMKKRAEIASIEVFAINVKQLLLAPPIRGKIILGVDPGFYHGCKLSIISEHGDVLDTAVIYPHNKSEGSYKQSVNVLTNLVNKYKCTVLALGNATACRETELFLTKIIESKTFGSLNVTYTVVDESGASIYSCSSEAKSEFPDLDPNLISAISIARRLQDPLAELVKVEPKHLGVGMYQHDLPEKQLLNALDEVVTEAVSFVGVDINTASEYLLRRVAGLTRSRAASIIEWRTKHGAFRNRQQLLDVKGIGSKTFEQCAGFIRILPETAVLGSTSKIKGSKNSKSDFNLLDQTWIHPESYTIASKFLTYCGCNLEDLGTPEFIENINSCARDGCANLAKRFDSNEATMEIIIKGLTMRKDDDIRLKSNYPLFRSSVQTINDLTIGSVLTGAVRNITHFGAFVDVGVGRNGLIHITRFKNHNLYIGQRVEVKVLAIERERNRINFELITTL